MAKILCLNDLHFNARNNSQIFANYFNKFYQNVLFPYIDEHKIEYVCILGDITDVRKTVNFLAATRLHRDLLKPLSDRGVKVIAKIGNHDSYYTAELSINSMQALYGDRELPGLTIIDGPTELNIDGCDILMLPWICSSNYAETMRKVRETRAQICFGHLELAGFEMYRGNFIEHGMDAALFQKFDMVLSGHYHHKSTQGNIHYLGTQFEITWADYDDTKGFHVFDTTDRSLTFVQNPNKIFHKVQYDDTKFSTLEDMMATLDTEQYAGSYVKLVVNQKTNPYWFDLFFDRLEKSEIVNLQIVDETLQHIYSEFQDTEGSLDDTITILNKYIEGLDLEANKDTLEGLMRSLYDEAVSLTEQQ